MESINFSGEVPPLSRALLAACFYRRHGSRSEEGPSQGVRRSNTQDTRHTPGFRFPKIGEDSMTRAIVCVCGFISVGEGNDEWMSCPTERLPEDTDEAVALWEVIEEWLVADL